MAEHLMASFGQGFVQTQVLSENNSVKYKLAFSAGMEQSSPANSYFTFQDNAIGNQLDGVGINLREYSASTHSIVSYKVFELSHTESAPGNLAFAEHMRTLPVNDNFIIITASSRIRSSLVIDELMAKIGTSIWPSKWLSTNYTCAYSGLYSIREGKIVSENVSYSDGRPEARDMRPKLEFIYDTRLDIGATGFSKRVVDDAQTYIIDVDNTSKRYPRQLEQISPMNEFGIAPGDTLQFSFEVKGDSSLISTGQSLRVNLRWFNGPSYISGTSIETLPYQSDQWVEHQRYVTVPANADGFTIIVARSPDTQGSVGTGAVREMLLTQVSRSFTPMLEPASIGVNGIRMNNMISVGVDENTLLVLPDTEDDMSGDIYSADFREYQ